jgi:DNA polymerase-3 subunit alpha
MKQFVSHMFEPKQKLTMANLKSLIDMNLIPKEYELNVRFFKYKDYISKKVHKALAKPKDKLFKLDNISTPFFNDHFSEDCIVDFENGQIVISEKQFKKEYDKKMEDIKEWLSKDETIQYINNALLEQEYLEYASGTVSKWEMESISYYYNEHELANVDYDKYGISNFTILPDEPEVVHEYEYRGRPLKEYKLTRIAGTVLDKDKNKHTVTLLTTDGVVTVKFYGGQFSFYNQQLSNKNAEGKKEVLEKSWFTRGNLLLVTGFRRGNQFVAKKYKTSIYQHSLAMIQEIDPDGNLILQSERTEV